MGECNDIPIGVKKLSKETYLTLYDIKLKEFVDDETKNPYFELAKSLAELDAKRKEVLEDAERCEKEYAMIVKRQETFLKKQGYLSRSVRNVGVNVNIIERSSATINGNHDPPIPYRPNPVIPQSPNISNPKAVHVIDLTEDGKPELRLKQIKDENPGFVNVPLVTMPQLPGNFKLAIPKTETTDKKSALPLLSQEKTQLAFVVTKNKDDTSKDDKKSYPTMKNGLKVPPKPNLTVSKQGNAVQLTWGMKMDFTFAPIKNYELHGREENLLGSNTSTCWRKVGDIKALPLPMSCTLTQFIENRRYSFSIRAVDIYNRTGEYSNHIKVTPIPRGKEMPNIVNIIPLAEKN